MIGPERVRSGEPFLFKERSITNCVIRVVTAYLKCKSNKYASPKLAVPFVNVSVLKEVSAHTYKRRIVVGKSAVAPEHTTFNQENTASFTARCCSAPCSENGYLAKDSIRYVCTNVLRSVTAAWLNSSHKCRDSVPFDSYVRE